MPYEIRLEVFEGPLDLLLHLIHRNEVNISDIPIALITRQYLETIELMQSLNLDVAGEYLVMATYLTHIKSQTLLPLSDETEEGQEGEDPREELIAHLLEYKRYKEAAQELGALHMLDRDVFTRETDGEGMDRRKSEEPIQVELNELITAFREVMARTSRQDLLELEPDRLLVKDKMREVLDRLDSQEHVCFNELFPLAAMRLDVVTMFLALLELMKLQLINVCQDAAYGTIVISRRAHGDRPEFVTEAMDSASSMWDVPS